MSLSGVLEISEIDHEYRGSSTQLSDNGQNIGDRHAEQLTDERAERERYLIRQAQQGDHLSFTRLVEAHDKQVMAVIFRFCGNRFDREDLYQEIFLHVYSSIGQFRFKSSFRTWLYRVALNRCLSFIRNEKSHPGKTSLDESESLQHSFLHGDVNTPASLKEKQEKLDCVGRALAELRGPQHISFHLFYIEDWPLGDIAELLDSSEGTVKSHLNRARTKIKSHEEVAIWLELD